MEEKRKYEVPKPKFRVDDYVRVLPRKEGQRYQLPNYIDDMLKYEGKVLKIRSTTNNGNYFLEENYYAWNEDWLEPAYNSIPKEQIDALFNEKVLVHSSFYDECWKDDYRKYILGQWEVDEPYYDYLPKKVVFDEKLGRTTLLFGEKPYKSVVNAKAKTISEFNFALGVKIALLKYFYTKDETKEMFDLVYNNFAKDKIEPYFDKLLKEKLRFLSEYQYNKLFGTKLLDGEIIFDIKGYGKHIIEIERK